MACSSTEAGRIYRGKVFIAERKSCCPAFKEEELKFIGNVTNFEISNSISKITQKDYTTPAGGNYCTVYETDESSISLTVGCGASSDVFKVASGGEITILENGAAVTDEKAYVKPGADSVNFKYIPDEAVAPVVKSSDGLVTYLVGDDYEVTEYGIQIVEGGQIDLDTQAAVDEELELSIDYTYVPQRYVKGLVTSGESYYLVFKGVNKSTGKRTVWKFQNVRFSPSDTISLIGDEFQEFALSGEILADPCGEEKYSITEEI